MKNYQHHLPIPELTEESSSSRVTLQSDDSLLLVRLSAIGDAVRLLPVAQYLRNNDFQGRIDCVVEPPINEFLELYPQFDAIHTVPLELSVTSFRTIFTALSTLRNRNYDWIFDMHGLLKSGLFSYLTGGQRRIGYSSEKSRELNYYFQTANLSNPLPPNMPRILKYLQLIRPVTPQFEFRRETISPEVPQFDPSTRDLEAEARKKPLLIHPSSSHSRYGTSKEWGRDNFVELIQNINPLIDVPVRITWGPGELGKAKSIAKEFKGETVEVAEEANSLQDLAYQLHHASLVVSVDTSVAHIADLIGVPLVAVFGGSNHHIHAPLLTNYRFVTRRKLEDSIEDIPVARVQTAIQDLLDEL
ncbi:MAG: glycosyltransferase family 9 protein [bacterium]